MSPEVPQDDYAIPRVVMASRRLRSPEKVVYGVLRAHADWPTPETVARAVGGTNEAVLASIVKLRDVGLVEDTLRGPILPSIPVEFFRESGLSLPSSEPVVATKPKPLNATTVEGWFQGALLRRHGAAVAVARWAAKERSLAKKLISEYGPAILKGMVEGYVTGSEKPPTFMGLWYDRERWAARTRERLLGRKTPKAVFRTARAIEDEWTGKDAPEIGWGTKG